MTEMRALLGILIAVLMAIAIPSGLVWATTGSGTTSMLVGPPGPPSNFGPFKVNRHLADNSNPWEVVVEAMRGLSIATQTITFAPGGKSGWHSHPGPVFISVREGTMTFYEEDCTATVRTAGEGFVDIGSHPHLARNESNASAINVVTYFAPPNTPASGLRIDEPQPLNCPL